MQDPPENVKEYPVTSDSSLIPEEKETCMNFPNDKDFGRISTDVPTMMKWIFSVEESDVVGVRMNDNDEIIGVTAIIPKGIIKCQGVARKSNSHSQMVTYGDLK